MKFSDYLIFVKSDLYRYQGSCGGFLKTYVSTPGFHYSFWLRTARYLKDSRIFFILYAAARLRLRSLQFKYGISLPYNTEIDTGLYIGHYGGIVVNHESVIGKNFNLNQGVTIGVTYGGKYPGVPHIGDNVYIGPGSFIIGGIEIGNNVAIGANTVVNKPISDNSIVVSSPGEIISYKGSGSYIVNTDY